MTEEIAKWIGDCELRYGRPRHPQSQGLVEKGNGSITAMLASMKASSDKPQQFKWSDNLPKVMFNMNTDYHSSIRTTAFRAVFGIEHNTGDKKTTTNIEDSLTRDSYDRVVKRGDQDLVTEDKDDSRLDEDLKMAIMKLSQVAA